MTTCALLFRCPADKSGKESHQAFLNVNDNKRVSKKKGGMARDFKDGVVTRVVMLKLFS
jgi:hypothetical protein